MSDPNTTFLEKHHPQVLKARGEKHEFEPMPMSDADIEAGHECNGGCYCNRCWERRANREAHFQRRRRKR